MSPRFFRDCAGAGQKNPTWMQARRGTNTMANAMDLKKAIQSGDPDALQRLLIEDASRANALVRWGKNDCVLTHPLHFVSDMLFEGTLRKGKELPLIEALI